MRWCNNECEDVRLKMDEEKFYNFVVEAKITFDIYEAEDMPDIDYLSSQLYDLLSEYTDDVEAVQIIRMEEIKKK